MMIASKTGLLTPCTIHADDFISESVTPSIPSQADDLATGLLVSESPSTNLSQDYIPLSSLVKSLLNNLSLALSNNYIDLSDPKLISSIESLTQWLDLPTDTCDANNFYSIMPVIDSLQQLLNDSIP